VHGTEDESDVVFSDNSRNDTSTCDGPAQYGSHRCWFLRCFARRLLQDASAWHDLRAVQKQPHAFLRSVVHL
jgi:hypothetical protein